ncbi:hypothetical protein TTHERM_00527390 (macronuclear) [Tetrahymena thermophila SB210]|uniref:Uncharacterized protein n=1 Tax=Tetrahymena thermophila (strain SB210) TaxID=312017 RepID=I7LY85_TETTS|nr:hypothetical protein TTHERM_00527390 [Tetrahymena thermophila SB210]EAS07902.2 hypothetical protein TTHERM_00527390 [Tetrahymena thermophila SB210]|eukprot:XP_001028144.2 hypothetical protein TTHERM_00527390 [Tetrahymena thermophila SB210]
MMQNINDIKAQLIMLGNSFHELRNIFAQQKLQSIPELLAIDLISGQIEGGLRKYAAKISNPIGPVKYAKGKEYLNNISRQISFFQRCLDQDASQIGYKILPNDIKQQILQNIQLQKKIIEFVDFFIEQAFRQKIGGVLQLRQPGDDFKQMQIYKNLDYTLQINIEQCYTNPCISNLINAAKQTCNKAHNIQNTICFYLEENSVKEDAQEINQLAGKLENSFRSILNSFGQEKDDIKKIKDVIKKEIQKCSNQSQKIINLSKKLQVQYQNDMQLIQNLCDQIIVSVIFFSEVQQLENISVH